LPRKVSSVSIQFPDHAKYELVSQMRRTSRSVAHNISEDYGRFHYKENAQFCRASTGLAYELFDQIIVSLEEGYIDMKN
jgi:four helix bundle protein